jgi:AAA+ ATPase superfamily predicted ATPase
VTRHDPAAALDRRPNPFEFGAEIPPNRLVDRQEEIDVVARTGINGGRMFLVGPRRYGKTSILAAAAARLSQTGVVVLRHDVETYETIGRLAEALLAGAARQLTGSLEKAGEVVGRLFARFRPHIDYDFADQTISVGLGIAKDEAATTLPILTDVLDAVDQMATEAGKKAVIILDEFQALIDQGGETAERQIRSVVQRHHHVAYIFAGSKTRMLADMTNSPERAFWKLGARYAIGPVPRADFLAFLRKGFADAGFAVEDAGLIRIMDLAQDVPYNVQQLAHMCWETLRVEPARGAPPTLTPTVVDRALDRVVAREDAPYTQLWTSLSATQRIVLRALIDEGGRQLRSAEVLARYGVASSTMTRTLSTLDDRGVIREEEHDGAIRHRLEDPFFAAWLRWAQRGS